MRRSRLASFPSKSLSFTVINSYLQKLSNLVTVKSNISTRIDFLLLKIVIFLRAITMCSAITPDCGYDNSTNILTGDVYCPNTKCLGRLCLHKKTSQCLGRSDYQCPHFGIVGLCSRSVIFHLKIKRNPFFVVWSRGLHFLRESKINSRCYWRCVLSWQILPQQREM